MTHPQYVTSQELCAGMRTWRPLIVHVLLNCPMTADELVGRLLAENYGNIDKETDLILAALNDLILTERVRCSRVSKQNDDRKIRTYLTALF